MSAVPYSDPRLDAIAAALLDEVRAKVNALPPHGSMADAIDRVDVLAILSILAREYAELARQEPGVFRMSKPTTEAERHAYCYWTERYVEAKRAIAELPDRSSLNGQRYTDAGPEFISRKDALNAFDTESHASQPLTAMATRFVWLIERGQPERQSPTVWWANGRWTEDANKADQFTSREAAETVIDAKFTPLPSRGGPSARAVEHGFLDAAASQPLTRESDT